MFYCISFTQDITPAQHPIIVLPFAYYDDLSSVIQFMYKGEINITQMKLPGLLGCAESLRVKGFYVLILFTLSIKIINIYFISTFGQRTSQN